MDGPGVGAAVTAPTLAPAPDAGWDDVGACGCGQAVQRDQDGLYCVACEKDPKQCACGALGRVVQLRNALVGSADLDSLPDPEPIIDGILYRDTLAWLHGKPGCGKSFVALDWSGCVSLGLPWQGRGTLPGTVLYLIAEGVSGLRQRVRAWEDHVQARTGAVFLPVAVQLLVFSELDALIGVAADLAPSLIVIDTQARVTVGADENSAKDMGELVAAADKLRAATRACVLIVHHEARAGENMRGSTALEGAATTQVRVTKDGPHLKIENPKQKDAPEFEPIRVILAPRLDSAVIQGHDGTGLDAELTATEAKLLEVLEDVFGEHGAAGGKLLEVSGVAKTSYYRALNRLTVRGTVANLGTQKRPHWVLSKYPSVRELSQNA